MKYRKQRQGGPGQAPARDQMAAFILGAIGKAGRLPSIAEVQAEMGWRSRQSVRDCLKKIAADGRVPHSVSRELLSQRSYGGRPSTWSAKEIHFIRSHYKQPGWSSDRIARALGKTRGQVIGKAYRLGVATQEAA